MSATPNPRDFGALTEKTNRLLESFHSHPFKSHEIQSQTPLGPPNPLSQSTSQQTDNYTRLSYQGTDLTGVSDSALVLDPSDKAKTDGDLIAFKKLVSNLKFAYLESTLKLSVASHILAVDGPVLISIAENEAKERERVEMKEELRARKKDAAELEGLIRAEAERLEAGLAKATTDAQLASRLVRESSEMELEIMMLRNKRTPIQRLTITECEILCDDQLAKLATCGPGIKQCERESKLATQRIRAHKGAIEQLAVEKRGLKKEQEAKGTRDESAEEGCRWITSATKLFESLLGVRGTYTIGTPPTEMRIEFSDPHEATNDALFRTLSVALGNDNRFTGARLVDSSDGIEDIVRAFLPSQDLASLVQEVRARISR